MVKNIKECQQCYNKSIMTTNQIIQHQFRFCTKMLVKLKVIFTKSSSAYVSILREKPDEIYMIGHDLHSHNDKINNIYKSTKHYTPKENVLHLP